MSEFKPPVAAQLCLDSLSTKTGIRQCEKALETFSVYHNILHDEVR